MRYGRLEFSDIAAVRRVVVALVVFQLAGAAIGVAYGYHHSWFMNFWAGGVLATPIGLIAGTIWHYSGSADRRESRRTIIVLGLLGTVVFLVAVFSAIPQMKSDMRMLATLSQFDREPIDRIEVFDELRKTEILTVTEPAIVAAFTRSISDAVGHSPSHPKYSRSWYAIVSGPKRYEFKLHLDPNYPESVVGYFLTRSEHPASYQVTFRSRALRSWVEEHLLRSNATD